MTDFQNSPIAIVGVAALFPGSPDAVRFWRNIRAGRDLISDVPSTHWLPQDHYDPDPAAPDKVYAKRGGFLPQVEFDAAEWGVPPKVMAFTDNSQLLALRVAEQVLRDALGGGFSTRDRSRASVILGVTSALQMVTPMVCRMQRPVWAKALREQGVPESDVEAICRRIAEHYVPWDENSFPGLLGNVVAGRIANRLNLGGTNCVVDAACASTFGALAMAVQELHLGESDLVITGGVDTLNDVLMFACFSKTPALSRTGDCRPFSEAADGTMLSEGLGMVALRRLADAERDGDPIYALLRGTGSSSDGRAKSVYAPVPEGQASALRRAQAKTGIDPRTIELMEAHGTGTKAGDAAEFQGLKLAFPAGEAEADRQWCALGSVKSQIGHAKGAAGAAGLFKAVMALHHKVLPPTIKVARPNPALGIEASAFYLNTVARPWIRGSGHPRRAAVSSFGFGGSNFHLLLEEYRGSGKRAGLLRSAPAELIVLGGRDGREVAARARELAARVPGPEGLDWAAWWTQAEFRPGAGARLAMVVGDGESLARRLDQAATRIESDPLTPFEGPDGTFFGLGPAPGAVGLLFPGQGSQYAGMGADLAMHFPAARAVWDWAADLVPGLERVVFPPPRFEPEAAEADEALLRDTRWAQPALGCASLAQLALLRALGLGAAAAAGHSFGELTALHASGVLSADAFLAVARRRGELMAAAAEAGGEGAMTAVRAQPERIRAVLGGLENVVLANLNAPDQTVLSGPSQAIATAEERLAAQGIRAQRLPVGAAFHSPLVAASATPFAAFLEQHPFAPAACTVYAGATAAPYEEDAAAQRRRLGRQLAEPVDFAATVAAMADAGIHTFIEVGPGAVLSGLVDSILAGRPHLALPMDRRGSEGVTSFLRGLGRLAARGVPLALPALWEGYRSPEDPGARPKARLPIGLCGANEKPYPPKGAIVQPPPAPAAQALADPPPAKSISLTMQEGQGPQASLAPAEPQPVPVPQARPAAAAAPGLRPVSAPGGDVQAHLLRVVAEKTGYPQDMLNLDMDLEADLGIDSIKRVEILAALQELVPGLPPVDAARMGAMRTLAQVAAGMRETLPEGMTPVPAPAPAASAPGLQVPPAAPAPSPDLQPLLLRVVAEKTGYPEDMLNLDMDLEADLGIDSIKRVEILAALQELVPGLPPVDAARMGAMRTLAQVAAGMRETLPGGVAPVPAPAAPAASALGLQAPPAAPPPVPDLQQLLLRVVSEKTGYPEDMLNLDMDLEADLGIDSIKRVEILAALQELVPGLPPVDAARMGAMRTLAQVAAGMRAAQPGNPVPAPAAPVPAAPAAAPRVQTAPAGLARHIPELRPAPALGLGRPGFRLAREVVVTPDGGPIAEALVAELRSRGVAAGLAWPVPPSADAVIFLGGLREVATAGEAMAVNLEALGAARAVAPGMVQAGRGLFVTVQDTGGTFGLAGCPPLRALLAGLPALAKTAALEWPGVAAASIDLERAGREPRDLARALAEELMAGGLDPDVALSGTGRRWVLGVNETPLAGAAPPPAARDVVVVSGGARGVTAACVVAWARRTRARFLLLGRNRLEPEPEACRSLADEAALKQALLAQSRAAGLEPTPLELSRRASAILAGREIQATLKAIAEAGGQARYQAVDVQRAEDVAAALAAARAEWGPITFLVHGAGILADKPIAGLEDDAFQQVFATKVEGLRVLLEATATDPLARICLFSSITSRCGNPGQAAYAMANEVLNKIAQAEARLRGGTALVKALAWGPWEGGMVTPVLQARFAQAGVPLIPLPVGARLFADEMAGGDPAQVEVVLGGRPRPGAGLGPSGEARAQELEVHLDSSRYGFLADHRIAGSIVVPLALAAEWFSRAAGAFRPGLRVRELRDLRVLRPIRLEGFPAGGLTCTIRCARGDAAGLDLEILGPEGTPSYQVRADMTAGPAAPAPAPEPAGQGPLGPWEDARVYGDVLFHGPAFQMIRTVDGIGPGGITGRVRGVLDADWPQAPWHMDPLALDSALQLAMLWARRQCGMAVLPMGLGSLRPAEQALSQGPLRVAVVCRRINGAKILADARWLAPDGTVLGVLGGVELILRPDLEADGPCVRCEPVPAPRALPGGETRP